MNRNRLRAARVLVAAVLAASVLSGCLFPAALQVSSSLNGETRTVGVSVSGDWSPCSGSSSPPSGLSIGCAFYDGSAESQVLVTGFTAILFAFFGDPIVVQLPDTVSGLRGTYAHAAGNGALVVQGPLGAAPIDAARSLTAEAGTRLYIVSVPEVFATANPSGVYGLAMQVDVPAGTPTVPVKAIITGLVRTSDGRNHYPPLFPCVTDFASAPAVTLDAATGASTTSLPSSASLRVCQGDAYAYASPGATAGVPVGVPALGAGALTSLVGVLAAMAALALRSRRRR